MAQKKDPALMFYPQDFITGTLFFSHEDVGIYIRLLCAQHQMGGLIPAKHFNSLVSQDSIVREKFIETEHGFYNERLMEEMVKRAKKSNNLSENAKKRWNEVKTMQLHCNSNANALQLNMPTEDEDENGDELVNNNSGKKKKEKPKKNEYRHNIKLTEDQHEKLAVDFGEEIREKAYDYLSDYKIEKDYKTKSDYHTIKRWVIDAVKKQTYGITARIGEPKPSISEQRLANLAALK